MGESGPKTPEGNAFRTLMESDLSGKRLESYRKTRSIVEGTMGESKHTSGPWAVDPNYEDSDKHIGIVAPPSTYALAWADNDDVPEGEGLANARLIAAAPLMLEALQAEEEARRVYNDWAPGDGLAQDRVRRARAHADELRCAAIKAATGGTQ